VLPVPFAFARMGVVPGVVTILVVAYSNTLTSSLLLRAAAHTGCFSYEGVAEAVGGRAWKVRRPLGSAAPLQALAALCMPRAAYQAEAALNLTMWRGGLASGAQRPAL